jgi:hypothetical protein
METNGAVSCKQGCNWKALGKGDRWIPAAYGKQSWAK